MSERGAVVPLAASTTLELALLELAAEVRALRADLRRSREAPDLLAAIEEEFAGARFTCAGLLSIADDEPHGALASALGDVVDMGASPRSRSTQLGALLSRLPEVAIVARQHGVSVYALRTLGA